jgi:chromosomal replication initiator protein
MSRTAEDVWKNCLKIIKDNVNLQSFKTWFEPIKPVKLDKGVLTIQVPSQFFYEWLEEHYVTLLRKTIKRELEKDARLEYQIVMDGNSGSSVPYTGQHSNVQYGLEQKSRSACTDGARQPDQESVCDPGIEESADRFAAESQLHL